MAFRILAFRYRKPEHREKMVERIKRATEVMAGCCGFVAADCWLEEGGDAVVAVGTFESNEQWLQAMQVVAGADSDSDSDFGFDERERGPRRVQLLVEA